MQNKKVVALAQLFYRDGTIFIPSEKEMAVVTDTIDLFRGVQAQRDRHFQYFDGLNLIEYIEDSVRRFNTNVDEREDMEDWQAGIHDPFTRNKIMGVLGRVLEVLPIAEFTPEGEMNAPKARLLTNLYTVVEEIDNYEELMTCFLLETIVKGTGIGYEDIEYQEKTYRDVKGIGDEITVTESKEIKTRLYGAIVPLEEFYPASVSIRRISDQPYCFWRKVIVFSQFIEQYGHYQKSQLVSGKQTTTGDEMRPYYNDFIDNTVPDGTVELIRFYDKLKDQYIILANGIWLNPINTRKIAEEGLMFEGEEISPLPWNHKELPFWDVKYEYFGDFFYGKSLADKLKTMQDVLNVLTNMLLDQSFLSIFPPLLTNGFDSIEDDYMRPGRRTPVDTQGLPISQAFQILQTPTPSNWHQFILQYTKSIMEEASLDKVSQGVAGQGDRTTAAEIRTAASAVAATLQMFGRLVNQGIKRKAMLKAANIIQFGFNKDAPIVKRIRGEGVEEEFNKAFATFTMNGVTLAKGKRGTRIIEMYSDKESLPDRPKIKARAAVESAEAGNPVEIVALEPSYIRNMQFNVKMVANTKSEKTKDIEQAIQLEKVKVYKTFFDGMINDAELLAETAEKLGDDPSKIIKPEVLNPQPKENAPMNQQLSTNPNDGTTNNMMRSTGGMDAGTAGAAQLQSSMLG